MEGNKREQELAQAEEWVKEGIKLFEAGKYETSNELLEQAKETFKQFAIWDRYVEVAAEIAYNYLDLGKGKPAKKMLEECLQLGRKNLGEVNKAVGKVYNVMGVYFNRVEDYKNAFIYYEKSLSIRLKVLGEEHWEVGESYNNLGILYCKKGYYRKGIGLLEKAKDVYLKSLGECHVDLASVYLNLGNFWGFIKHKKNASMYTHKALKILIELFGEEHSQVANLYHNMAMTIYDYRNVEKRMFFFKKALALQLKYSNLMDAADTYCTMAVDIGGNEEYQSALDLAQKAWNIYKQNKFGKKIEKYVIACSIGKWSFYLKDYKKAFEYFEIAEKICFELNEQGKGHRVILYMEIALLFLNEKRLNNAKDYLEKAENMIDQLDHNVYYTYVMTKLHMLKAKYLEYLQFFDEALLKLNTALKYYSLNKIKGLTSVEGNVITSDYDLIEFSILTNKYYCLSLYFKECKKVTYLKKAFHTLSKTFNLIFNDLKKYNSDDPVLLTAKQTNKISGQIIQTALILSQHPEIPPTDQQNYLEQAYIFAEKSKATLLLHHLQDNKAKIEAKLPSELVDQEYDLKVELNYLEQSIKRLEAQPEETRNQDLLKEYRDDYFEAIRQYDQLTEQLKEDYPDYHYLKYNTKTISIADLQAHCQQHLSPNTLLIEYFVGEEQIYIITIAAQHFVITPIAKPDDLAELILAFRDQINFPMGAYKYSQAAYPLYQLLIQPIEPYLNGKQQLLLMPDEELFNISFEAFITEPMLTKGKLYSDLAYLQQAYTISYHYSATLLHYNHHRRTIDQEQIASFIGFAPIYSSKQDLLAQQRQAPDTRSTLITEENYTEHFRSVLIDGEEYVSLPYSETEVKTIAQAFQNQNLPTQLFLAENASLTNLKTQLQGYKYVLIAAHGDYTDDAPDQTSIILSPDAVKNEKGQGAKLYLSDTYYLQLDADLVVLSCCNSGVGEIAKGEGVLTLGRGFLYAGAKNVIFTLFKVEDKASSQLTIELFHRILAGDSYAQALSKAKRKLIQNPDFGPIHWAGYILVGV